MDGQDLKACSAASHQGAVSTCISKSDILSYMILFVFTIIIYRKIKITACGLDVEQPAKVPPSPQKEPKKTRHLQIELFNFKLVCLLIFGEIKPGVFNGAELI